MSQDRVRDFREVVSHMIEKNDLINLTSKEKQYAHYGYHFTDINNAASILNSGKLLSRNRALESKLMINDNASKDVILSTHPEIMDYVRFYFRPQTPTQFRNEGIMSKTEIENSSYKAHCPIPVFLLFNSWDLLGMEGMYFTSESLAKHHDVKLYNDIANFESMPFDRIFHNRSLYNNPKKAEIISNRHAEIVMRDELKIDKLKYVYVRSLPEKEYLLTLLDQDTRNRYEKIILIDNKKKLFYGSRAYLISSVTDSKNINLNFNTGNSDPEFNVRLEIRDLEKGIFGWGPKKIKLSDMPSFDISKEELHHYEIKIYLDNIKAYQSRYDYISDDLPF